MTERAQARPSSVETRRLGELERQQRRDHGVVYTPEPLVSAVLDHALGEGRGPSGITLDPACGTGVFLRAVVARIAAECAGRGLEPEATRAAFLAIVSTEVWGLDVDEVAVELARREVRSLVEQLSPGPPPDDYLKRNIVVGDFLKDNLMAFLPARPRHIIGNPPYVSIDRIPAPDRQTYRSTFISAFGRIDLYTLFMERSAQLLEPGGSWTFITPDKFLSSASARPVRELLSSTGSFKTITIFASHRVFAGAATVPCITVW